MDLRLSDIPGLAIERATNSLLDTVGVTLPGLEEPATRIAVQLALSSCRLCSPSLRRRAHQAKALSLLTPDKSSPNGVG